jgi:eukaryotic-like serine/threonine-protein kinase
LRRIEAAVSTAKFAQLKSIFSRALELPEDQVAAYLDEVCAGKAELRRQVEEMVRQAVSADTELLVPVEPERAHALELGAVLANRFELKRFVGRGGMGEVYLAEDRELGGDVALKTVRGGLLGSQGVARFRREVQLSRQVTHANICRVFDVGKEVVDGQDMIFLTMEYLEGETLGQHLAKVEKIGVEEAEPLVRQLAAGLDALHEKGIMHRDLKPANVMLVGRRLCIMDFGLARAFQGGTGAEHTQTGAILGTPGYMSPEQLMGESATASSDIYSMGLLIFEMLTGKKASTTDSLAAGKTGLPEVWENLVLTCTAREPGRRPKSAAEAMTLLDVKPVVATQWKGWQWAALALVVVGLGSMYVMRNQTQENRPTVASTSVNDEIERARGLLVRYYKPQNVREAMSVLDGIVKANPELALGHATQGMALYRMFGDTRDLSLLEKAKDACNRAVQLDPEMAEPRVTLGNIYLTMGRKDLARSELKQALELDSKSADVHFVMAQLYRAEGRTEEKDAAIQKAIDLAPDHWNYYNWKSSELRDAGRYEEALVELQRAEKLMPDNPLIYNNLGVLMMRMRRLSESRKAYERSQELEPRPRTLGNLGTAYYLEGNYEKAVELFQKASEADGKSYLLWANFGAALDRLPKRKPEAIEAYKKAIALAEPLLTATPNDQRIMANLASYYALLGNRERAQSLIRRAIALQPDSPDVANRAVAVYEFLKERDLALQWAQKALENGYSFETLNTDPELADLRADPRFKKLEGRRKETK